MRESNVYMVWDGDEDVVVPPPMGTPREDQLTGSTGEQVSELACRICYDSLGAKRSRDTKSNLEHIKDVNHLSTVEHYNRSFRLMVSDTIHLEVITALNGRPGVLFRRVQGPGPGGSYIVTLNPRSVLEWDVWTERCGTGWTGYPFKFADMIGKLMKVEWAELCPILCATDLRRTIVDLEAIALKLGSLYPIEPQTAQESWISLYMRGSRGFSHELVRHGNFTAISQRSTRYVKESDSPWDYHPLIKAYESANREGMYSNAAKNYRIQLDALVEQCRGVYDMTVEHLRPWLLKKIDKDDPYRKHTARKQARGAARGFLGNALRTEVIFSASVSQWQHMLRMRAADAADAEIRVIFAEALVILQKSQYGSYFADFTLAPSSDGIRCSLAGGGAK